VFFGISAVAGYAVPASGSMIDLAAANWNTAAGAACFFACAIAGLVVLPSGSGVGRAVGEDECEHEADHADDHEDQPDGLDVDAHERRGDREVEDRAHGDQEERGSESHAAERPAGPAPAHHPKRMMPSETRAGQIAGLLIPSG
jgi:hypothetical protein